MREGSRLFSHMWLSQIGLMCKTYIYHIRFGFQRYRERPFVFEEWSSGARSQSLTVV